MPAYCRSCVLPDTRPGVRLDADGICAGCRYAEHKRVMDWSERAAAFKEVVRTLALPLWWISGLPALLMVAYLLPDPRVSTKAKIVWTVSLLSLAVVALPVFWFVRLRGDSGYVL